MNIQELINKMKVSEFSRSKNRQRVKYRLQYNYQVRSLTKELEELDEEEL